jgi:Phasin protein
MVAAATRAQANGKSPIHSMYQMYFGGLEAFGQAYDPFMKGFARAQLEWMGLISRRAQAYMEVPSRLSRCRTPQDLVNEQARFWRTAYEEYSDTTGRITEALASCTMPSFGFGSGADAAESARDYITFPETKEPGRGARERKAA